MPMGIVSDKQFESERSKLTDTPKPPTKVHTPEVMDMPRGRGENNVGVPESLKNLIGVTAISEGREEALDLARQFGISDSSTSAYSVGANSTSTYNQRPNAPVLNKVKERISKKARRLMIRAMDSITDPKLENSDATELASIAKSMSGIVRDMEPDTKHTPTEGANKPGFIVYAPKVFNENHYEVIVAKE